MLRFFISYSRADRLFLDLFVPTLRAEYGERSVWFDDQIPGGVDWWQTILTEISACDIFIFLMTNESLTSASCQGEFREALRLGKAILPLLARPKTDVWGNAPADIEPVLRKINYLDLSKGVSDTEAIARLHGSIHHLQSSLTDRPSDTAQPAANVMDATSPPHDVLQVNGDDTADLPAARTVTDILPTPFEWCTIPEGMVEIIDPSDTLSDDASGRMRVNSFVIAKYPITNSQFQVFVDAPDGYEQESWWDFSRQALEWRREHQKPQDLSLSGSNHPRTNVNWFEAIAFCRWLSDQIDTQVLLPSEQQWQRAAQGNEEYRFPWGDEFDRSLCNYSTRGTTPVTQYPQGSSPFGVMDMCGNVLEWCLNEWATGNIGLEGARQRVLRGGSWHRTNVIELESTYRASNFPDFRVNNRGFRIVILPE